MNNSAVNTQQLPKRLESLMHPSVWLEFTPLANHNNSVNLGQGFPGWEPPQFVREAAANAVCSPGHSQYARPSGHISLVEQICESYGPGLQQTLDPAKQIVVTNGASGGIYLALLSLIEAGDEVLLIEPAFDIYRGALALLGAEVISVSLEFRSTVAKGDYPFQLDLLELEKKITQKTKVLVLNTPHNPTGKVFSRSELQAMAEVVKKFPNLIVVSDEVYEHLIFDENQHFTFASVPGMASRTLSVYSAGKTFSVTGWKIGWVIGPENLIQRMQICQQWTVFSVNTPFQEAMGQCLIQARKPFREFPSYYHWLAVHYQQKRNILFAALQERGFQPIKPQGSFFILADIGEQIIPGQNEYLQFAKDNRISVDATTLCRKDYQFSRFLCRQHAIATIPCSAFYKSSNDNPPQRRIRFAFCKPDAVLRKAIENLPELGT